ncbi:MAG: imidazole glycerol phosphate synthase subunit HisH [Tissierellales bacterium]|nr:imidazole glycerol phosphate synthase subunit HisH [Tissierellales bacterium]MBN2828224.1 imidazole glycerol phosphate synthase subunit HisH [Tissierellales bacterium]
MHVIVDYGLGNLNSVQKGFERVGLETVVTDDLQKIKNAKSIILPGVGAFRDAIERLKKLEMFDLIIKEAKKGKPIIGICLGMQLLYDKSYEYGEYKGLGLMKGEIKKMEISLKVPHMGWNSLKFNKNEDPILKYISEGEYVYYVHSYYADGMDKEQWIATSDYEITIPGIVRNENIYGIQFHPEKSGMTGHKILEAYKELII